jgi:hypothetical protein
LQKNWCYKHMSGNKYWWLNKHAIIIIIIIIIIITVPFILFIQ